MTSPSPPFAPASAPAPCRPLSCPLSSVLSGDYNVDSVVISVLTSILHSIHSISEYLRTTRVISKTSTHNIHGDAQLSVDVAADQFVLDALRANPHVATAASEEHDDEIVIHHSYSNSNVAAKGTSYSVAFDPLDGSSIIDANFAVGAIFGVYKGVALTGMTGRAQCASMIAQFGPRTTILLALPKHTTGKDQHAVLEAQLDPHDGKWWFIRGPITIGDGKTFAPGNLRAAVDDPRYGALIMHWINNKYTLRYTGGMVPDVYHIFTKKQGIFVTPVTKQSPAKLRLLYECAPLALLMECAGGASVDDTGSTCTLDLPIPNINVRCGIAIGSKAEVERYKRAMKGASLDLTSTDTSSSRPKSKL